MKTINESVAVLDVAYTEYEDTKRRLDELREIIDNRKSEIRKHIEVKEKRGSTILIRPDGLAIHITKRNSRHYERTVSWYDTEKNRKGDKITSSSRDSISYWKLWLARTKTEKMEK
jgi:tetrahydromethanopterin S-methyltransferase subunit G